MIKLHLNGNPLLALGDGDIGKGFKLNVNDSTPITSKAFQGGIEKIPLASTSADVFLAKDFSTLSQSLGVEGELSVSYGPISGTGSASYNESMVSSGESIVYHYEKIFMAYANKLQHPKVINAAAMNPDNIGTKFIESVTHGAVLNVTLTITSSNKEEIEKLKGELKVNVAGFASIKAKVNKYEKKSRSTLSCSVRIRASGDFIKVRSEPTLDDIKDTIDKFDEAIRLKVEGYRKGKTLSVMEQLPIIAFSLSSIKNYISEKDQIKLEAFGLKLGEISKVFSKTKYDVINITSWKDRMEAKYKVHPRDYALYFSDYAKEVEEVCKQLQQTISECVKTAGDMKLETMTSEEISCLHVPEVKISNDRVEGLIGRKYIECPGKSYHYVGFAKINKRTKEFTRLLEGMYVDNETQRVVVESSHHNKLDNKVLAYIPLKRIVIGQANHPDRIMINHSDWTQEDYDNGQSMNWRGWNHKQHFWAFRERQPDTIRIAVGEAHNPHRVMMNHRNMAQKDYDNGLSMDRHGWKHKQSFWVYPSRRPKTIRIAVGEAHGPHRVMMNLSWNGERRRMTQEDYNNGESMTRVYPSKEAYLEAMNL